MEHFQLLDTEKLPILASTARACFLLFESMRLQLKFQLEAYFHKLRAIVVSEQVRGFLILLYHITICCYIAWLVSCLPLVIVD